MEEHDRRLSLYRKGVWTEGMGPELEWDPVSREEYQKRHDMFWSWVGGIMPERDEDELFWMTEEATQKLANN